MTQRKNIHMSARERSISPDARLSNYEQSLLVESSPGPGVTRSIDARQLSEDEMNRPLNRVRMWIYKATGVRQ